MTDERKPIVYDIPAGTAPSKCRGCGAEIYWVKTRQGKNTPANHDGTSHFSTCPKADDFRKGAKKPACS
jgi:hypothetical protein